MSDNLDEILARSVDLGQNDSQGSLDGRNLIVEEEREKLGCLIFRHNAKLRMYWDLFIIILALYNCITIPTEVAF